VGGSSRRRWSKRLAVAAAVGGAVAALREWKLNENANRLGR